MYEQMWRNIDRHILVVWQAAGSLVGAAALLVGVEKKVLSIDLAVLLMVIGATWLIGHVIDAHYWFARNLAIITNIERSLLRQSDLQLIHPYFGIGQRKPPLLDHLMLQACLGAVLLMTALGTHFTLVVLPTLEQGLCSLTFLAVFPWAAVPVLGFALWLFTKDQRTKLDEFYRNAPGPTVLRD